MVTAGFSEHDPPRMMYLRSLDEGLVQLAEVTSTCRQVSIDATHCYMGITSVGISGRLALACRGCGEIILFLGRERDWYEPGTNVRPRSFVCSGCGTSLTDRVVGAGATSSR
jgi:hypothetical protein